MLNIYQKIFRSLIMLFVILLGFFPYALGNMNTSGLRAYYNFDLDNGYDYVGGNNNIPIGGSWLFYNGILNKTLNMTSGSTTMNNSADFSNPTTLSINFWYRSPDTTTSWQNILGTDGSSNWQLYASGGILIIQQYGVANFAFSNCTYTNTEWNFYSITYHNSNDWVNCYKNGRLTHSGTATFNLGTFSGAVHGDDTLMYIDELSIYLEELTSNNATYLYNLSGDVFNELVIADTTPTLILNTSLQNSTNINEDNILITYNGTYTNTNGIFNCSLLDNETVINSSLNVNISTLKNWNISFVDTSKEYLLNINCTNADVSKETSKYSYRVDTIIPVLLTDYINNTAYTEGETLTYNYNCSDSNLFAVNNTIKDINGNVVYNRFSTNLTGNNFYSNSTTYVLNSITNMYIDLQCWDSHTLKIIPNYNWDKYQITVNNDTYKGISFRNNYFNLSTNLYNQIDDFYLIKKSDRFLVGFNFKPSQVGNVFTMYLGTKGELSYIPIDSNFVLNYQHWIDFISNDIRNLQIDYLPQYNIWRIRFIPLKQIVVFRSIGDLNYVEYIYTIDVDSETDLTNSLLTNLSADLKEFKNVANEGSTMLWLIIFCGIFVFAGVLLRMFWLWCIAGVGFILIAISQGYRYIQDGLIYQSANMWVFLFFGLAFLIGGVALHVIWITHINNQNQSKNLYSRIAYKKRY